MIARLASRRLSLSATILSAGLLAAGAAAAGPVALKGGLGQGITFSHRGLCYVLFPAHVEPTAPILNLFTAPPQRAGRVTVYLRRAEADIALGLVEGSAAEDCGPSFESLSRDVSGLLAGARTAVLERVNPQGALERLALRIENVAWAAAADEGPSGLYQFVFATTDGAGGETREVFEGTSGAFLYVDDVPVAMTVTSPDETRVRALRIEEALDPIARWFATGSLAVRAAASPEAAAAPAAGLAFDVTEWTGTALTPPTGLAAGAALRVEPGALPFSFVIDLGPAPVALRGLTLAASPETADAAPPRLVAIEVDRSRGAARFQPAGGNREMARTGTPLEIALPTFARRIRVTLLSGWSDAVPTELAGVSVAGAD